MAEGTLLFLRILPSSAQSSPYHLFVCLFIHLKALGIEPNALHIPSKHTSTLVSWEMVSLYASDRPRIHGASALASWMWAQQAYATIYGFDVLLESVWGRNRTHVVWKCKEARWGGGYKCGSHGAASRERGMGKKIDRENVRECLNKTHCFLC